MLTLAVIILLSYLVGSFPTGFVFAKLIKGVDIRTIGSKSTGATNTSRLLGTKIAIVVLLIDVFKGLAATLIISRINLGDIGNQNEWIQLIAGICAIVGHIFPIWIGFKGGKGVGTGAGMLLGLMPLELIMGFILFVVVVALTRYISLGSILIAVFVFAALLVESLYLKYQVPISHFVVSIIFLLAILITHRENIKRLVNGTENKFGQKPA
ncbi:MAG: glycerol-3-phosphate 1-O-acyltransferase PlsY [candidate division Zixibacteria bacterium]|nr:glycerol-3-phosphate 1-O-acyltransferase PlsY [candidate division Zixibacteria bacterium]